MLQEPVFEQLKNLSADDLATLDDLMHQLSPNSSCTRETLENVLNDINSHLFVCRLKGRIIACATLCVMHSPEFTLASVEAVVVDSSCRGMGIGRKLMQQIILCAKECGVRTLHLTSNPKRVSANILYKSLGFELYDTNCYRMKETF